MQLQVKTILNAIQHFPGFVYQDIHLRRHRDGRPERIEIKIEPHESIPARCSRCVRAAPGYDRLAERPWLFVPLWGIVTWFRYAARRVQCPEHGVVVEHLPWSDGKRPVTIAMMCFVSRWARRLSWRETARAFHTSWECVYARWNGLSNGAWRIGSWKAFGRSGWMKSTGAKASGPTTS